MEDEEVYLLLIRVFHFRATIPGRECEERWEARETELVGFQEVCQRLLKVFTTFPYAFLLPPRLRDESIFEFDETFFEFDETFFR